MHATLLSITVGQIQRLTSPTATQVDSKPPTWSSAIFKSPIPSATVTPDIILGDAQADPQNHGGPDNVVLAYSASLYPAWRTELDLPNLPFGAFGENFTLEGDFSDDTVCIGDIWHVGDPATGVTLQVTQPRQPCYKLARRLNRPLIVKLVKERANGGWYSRVLKPGTVKTNDPATLLERFHPQWTCAAAAAAMYARNQDPARAAALAQLPELSARWKSELLDAF